MTFDDIVADYIREYRDDARAEIRFFEIQRSPTEAIRKAALCQMPGGKRHPHQRRIPRVLLEQVEGRLQGIRRKLAKAPDFATVHRLVRDEVGSIRGIGALTVYDISHRIGAYFGKAPELVYLHAGTKTGARTFNIGGEAFDPEILPKPFSRLAPAEIEDCLCIYKDELKASHNGAVSKSPMRSSFSPCRPRARILRSSTGHGKSFGPKDNQALRPEGGPGDSERN